MSRAWRLLRGEPVTAIYTSPSRRALESASVRAIDGPAVTVDERLREIDFGEFEGLTYDDIAKQFPEQYEVWMTRPTDVLFPGGESFGGMSARVLEAIDDIRRRHRGKTVVTVSHGGVNRIVLAAALDLDPRRIFRLDQAYASVNVIDYIGDEPLVRLLNAAVQVPC
jgi:broad specificity phosphatase PhoE